MKKRSIINKVSHGFTLGVSIGVFISIFINIILNTNYFSVATPLLIDKFSSNLATFICILGYGFIGIFSSISGLVFENEKLSLLKATIVHFLLIQIILIIIGYLFFWLSYYFTLVLPISVFVYFVIWLINYIYYKREISNINSKVS